MTFLTVQLLLVALATIACGNGWCNQAAFQKYTISSPLLFSCDDSNLKTEISSLRQTVMEELAELRQQQQACNVSALIEEISQLREEIRALRDDQPAAVPTTATPIILGSSPSNPAASCNEIFEQDSNTTTGNYWLHATDDTIIVNVTCDFDLQLPPPGPIRGWQELANIDLSDTTQSCPLPLSEVTSPTRRCQRASDTAGCESVTFPTYSVPFTKLCGRVVGYSSRSTDVFEVQGICYPNGCTINGPYVDGVSITYGDNNHGRQHIWSLAAEHYINSRCPCGSSGSSSPTFVENNFYCEVAQSDTTPLWDGVGCTDIDPGDAPCCENPNFPWFCRQFNETIVTDFIEVRLCTDDNRDNEDIQFDLLKLYVQ